MATPKKNRARPAEDITKVDPPRSQPESSGIRREVGGSEVMEESTQEHMGSSKKRRGKRSPKVPSSFEQLIDYAYKKKGRKLSLASKHEKTIAKSLSLSDEALARLNYLVEKDVTFAVPTQLLLLAHTVPRIRRATRAFVQKLLLVHPALQDAELQAFIQNLDGSLSPQDALAKIVKVDFSGAKEAATGKKAIQAMRLKGNLVCCLAVWIAETDGLYVATISELLYRSYWSVKSGHLTEETAQVRALIEVNDMEGVGVACQMFQRVAEECRADAKASMQEAGTLRSRLGRAEEKIENMREELEAAKFQFQSKAQQMERLLADANEAARNEATHLRDDYEVLRTRILRALRSDLSLLEDGLEALRRPVPKVTVMKDVAERVTDSMRQGIREVQGDR